MSSSPPTADHDSSPMVKNSLEPRAPRGEASSWRSRLTTPSAAGGPKTTKRLRTFSSSPVRRGIIADDSLNFVPLSERDSIFATTYGPQNDREVASPALSATAGDRIQRGGGPYDSTILAMNPPGESSSPPSNKPDFLRRSTVSDLILASMSHEPSGQLPYEKLTHGPRRNDSDDIKRAKNLEKRQHVTKGSKERPQIAYSLHMSIRGRDGRYEVDDSKLDGKRLSPSTKNGPMVRKDTARSSSFARAQQSIEATLATDEPRLNARSRKASHYLGLFRENAASGEQRKQFEPKDHFSNTMTPSGPEHDLLNASRTGRTLEVGDSRTGDISIIDTESEREDHSKARNELDSGDLQEFDGREEHANERRAITTSNSKPALKEPLPDGQGRPTVKGESIEWRSTTPSGDPAPLRLLEDIRSQPNLESVKQRQIDAEAGANDDACVHQIRDGLKDLALHGNLIGVIEQRQHVDEDPEYESDKEHISSATYFPHQAPSPDGSDEGRDEENVPKLVLDGKEALSPKTIAIDAAVGNILPEAQYAAKSLQSKAPVRSIEHALEPGKDPSEFMEALPKAHSSDVSLSDTDNESTDNTILSDREESPLPYEEKTELTPVVTPRPAASLSSPRMGRAPLGAVELKPYKHQVGGHTKVFSFSRQAICKQLNNRENEFYEVIERNHPELLRFLPRYLGVLNVTYQKVSKRKQKFKGPKLEMRGSHDSTISTKQGLHSPRTLADDTMEETSLHRPHSAPRAVSHSQHFDMHDDTVPQVVYADNMHMIPINLFPTSPVGPTVARPSSSTAVPIRSPPRQSTALAMLDAFSVRPDLRRPLPQSPSWGATTVNTKFKDKVLREVFSPPVVHQRKRQGYPRQEAAHHQRGYSHAQHLSYPERLEGSPLMRSVTPDIAPNREGFRSTLAPPPPPRNARVGVNEEKQAAPMPTQLPEAISTSSVNGSSAVSDSTDISHADSRVIQRRRSGGGLRRGQVDIDTNKRSAFKYYEEEATAPIDAEPIFAMDPPESRAVSALASNAADQTTSHSSHDHALIFASSGTSEADHDTAPVSTALPLVPTNPLQAQQQPDRLVRHFLLLEDLTANMSRPCVLDLKMGTRQYGVEATKKKQMSQRAKCKTTTSHELGVRVCGMQVWNESRKTYVFEDKYAGRDVKPGRDFQNALVRFLHDGTSDASVVRHIPTLLDKLSKLEKIILKLPGYRFYASSLLMLYDGSYGRRMTAVNDQSKQPRQPTENPSDKLHEKENTIVVSDIDVRLVDFANCLTAEDQIPEEAPCPPRDRYSVDRGYIRGLRSLRTYLQRIWKEIEEGQWVERGEGEGMGLRMKGAGLSRDQPESWQEGYDDPGDVSI